MKKEYFFVNPSNFARLGEINIDGEYEYVQCEDFKLDEPKEDYLFFEVRYEEYKNKRFYSPVAKEVITGRKFNLDVKDRRNRKTNKFVSTAVLTSDELGLYSRVMAVSDIERQPSRLSGIFHQFEDYPEEKENYCKQLKEMFEEAQSYKYEYDRTINGPSWCLRNQIKRTFKKM